MASPETILRRSAGARLVGVLAFVPVVAWSGLLLRAFIAYSAYSTDGPDRHVDAVASTPPSALVVGLIGGGIWFALVSIAIAGLSLLRGRVVINATELVIHDGVSRPRKVQVTNTSGVAYLPGSVHLNRSDGGLFLLVGDDDLVRLPLGDFTSRQLARQRSQRRAARWAQRSSEALPPPATPPEELQVEAQRRHLHGVVADLDRQARMHELTMLPAVIGFALFIGAAGVDLIDTRLGAGLLCIGFAIFCPVIPLVRLRAIRLGKNWGRPIPAVSAR